MVFLQLKKLKDRIFPGRNVAFFGVSTLTWNHEIRILTAEHGKLKIHQLRELEVEKWNLGRWQWIQKMPFKKKIRHPPLLYRSVFSRKNRFQKIRCSQDFIPTRLVWLFQIVHHLQINLKNLWVARFPSFKQKIRKSSGQIGRKKS